MTKYNIITLILLLLFLFYHKIATSIVAIVSCLPWLGLFGNTLLEWVGECFARWNNAGHQLVACKGLALAELDVGAMKPIQNAKNAETLIKPEKRFQFLRIGPYDVPCDTYFKWWKSCASGLGKKGKWYPEWAFNVFKMAKQNQSQAVEMWLPIK